MSPVVLHWVTPVNVDRRRVLQKLDWHLLPFVSLLYLVSYRANIGNAKVAGLAADLKLTGLQYNLCSAIFFAGLFHGVTFYLCLWYRRIVQAQRASIFLSPTTAAASLSHHQGLFGSILGFGIEKMSGIGGLAGWSWIFLLEVTVVVAVLSYLFMYDFPETATFLSETEREWLIQTPQENNAGLSSLRDPHSYIFVGSYLFVMIPTYAFALFLNIIAGLGYSASHAQLLSVPHWRPRGPFILARSIAALVGHLLPATFVRPLPHGTVPRRRCMLTWTGGNTRGDIKRGVVIAMAIGIGNLGGESIRIIASSFIYRPQDCPYHHGHAADIRCLCVSSQRQRMKAHLYSGDLSPISRNASALSAGI
ncbi:hypothetical protein BKA93DRAFT_816011 [Sparassis latifolia]